MRKTIQNAVYYVLPLGLFSLAIIINESWLYSKFGEYAILAFHTVLFVKPLSVLTPYKIFKILMTYRRQLGLTTFWLFAFHAFGMYLNGIVSIKDTLALNINPFVLWGMLGGLGLTILASTSNDFAVRTLKKNWKKLHRIAYPAYYFALYHSSLGLGEIWRFYVIGGVYALLKFLEFRKLNKTKIVSTP